MPKLGFTINSRFDPTSIEDYSKMFKSYIDTYKDYETRYQTLIDNASLLEKLQANTNDKAAYDRYSEYLKDVEELANNLATNGWDRNKDIAGAMKAKKDYMQIIKPIEEAYNTRDALAKEQRAANRNGDLLYDVDFSNVSIDNILADPTMGYKSISQSEVEKIGKSLGAAYSSRMPLTLSAVQRYGSQYLLSSKGASVAEAMNMIKSQSPELKEIITQAYDSTGVENGNFNEQQKKQVLDRIVSGVLQGLVKEDSFVANRDWGNSNPSNRTPDGNGAANETMPFIQREALLNAKGETVYVPYTIDLATGKHIYKFEDVPGRRKEDFLRKTGNKDDKGNDILAIELDKNAKQPQNPIYLVPGSNSMITVTDGYGQSIETGLFDRTKHELDNWTGEIYISKDDITDLQDLVYFNGTKKGGHKSMDVVIDTNKSVKSVKGKLNVDDIVDINDVNTEKDEQDGKYDPKKLTVAGQAKLKEWIKKNGMTESEFRKAFTIYKRGNYDFVIVKKEGHPTIRRKAYNLGEYNSGSGSSGNQMLSLDQLGVNM